MKLVSKSQFSRMEGVTPAAVSYWLGKGAISEERNGKINPKKARDELRKWNASKRKKEFSISDLEIDLMNLLNKKGD